MKTIILVDDADIRVFDPADIVKDVKTQKPVIHTDNGIIEIRGEQFVNKDGNIVLINWTEKLQTCLGLPFEKFARQDLVIKRLADTNLKLKENAESMIIARDNVIVNRDKVILKYENMSVFGYLFLAFLAIFKGD